MIDVLIYLGLFILSLAVLIVASNYFIVSSEKIGLFFGLPPFIIGVTIVALGTSLPELVSSIFAVLQGSTEIVVGNVIGSNIANIFLVLGIAAILGKKLIISFELIHVDLPFIVGSTFLLAATIWDGIFTWQEGIICLAVFIVYLVYTTKSEQENNDKEIKKEMKSFLKSKKKNLPWTTWLVLFLSAFFIFIGAKYTIDSVIHLSSILNIGTEIIALTAIALGTSLPELIVTVSAARKGKAEIAVGNVLGSNIFNTLAVMGIPAFIKPLSIPQSILAFGLPMLIMATLLYFFITQDREITIWEGCLLVIFYVFFIGKVVGLV
jgi:cation:H+ antiporter